MNPNILAALAADPAMDFLGPTLLPKSATEILSRALGRGVEVAAVRVTRHKPGRRCVIEYDLRPETGLPQTLVAKVRVKGADQRTFALLRTLWENGFDEDASDGIHIPEPLAIAPEFRMLLTAKVPGVPAGGLLYKQGRTDLARRIAAVAWKLHRTGVPSPRTHTAKDELLILRDRVGKVAAARPDWSQRLAKVLDQCEQIASRLPPAEPRGIHRDFYPAQVLVDGSRCWLLDLDLYCLGDPALDIGNFIGHMTEHSLRTLADPETVLETEIGLRNEYVRLSCGATIGKAIDIYKLLTVARHIYISTLFADRQAVTSRLLEYCEREMNQGIWTR
jgi:hypothetical protein